MLDLISFFLQNVTLINRLHSCPWIWSNVHIAVPIVYAYLFVLALTSMLRTSWSDPGVSEGFERIYSVILDRHELI